MDSDSDLPNGAHSDRWPKPDQASRASRDPFAALDDLEWHAEFHRRHPAAAIFPTADLETLIAANVRLAAERDQAHAQAAGEHRRAHASATAAAAATELGGELAVRRLLDDLIAAGLPSALYSHATPEFREYVGRMLTRVAETSNRLLGALHAIPASAWVARDPEADDDDVDGQVDLFRRLMEDEPDADA